MGRLTRGRLRFPKPLRLFSSSSGGTRSQPSGWGSARGPGRGRAGTAGLDPRLEAPSPARRRPIAAEAAQHGKWPPPTTWSQALQTVVAAWGAAVQGGTAPAGGAAPGGGPPARGAGSGGPWGPSAAGGAPAPPRAAGGGWGAPRATRGRVGRPVFSRQEERPGGRGNRGEGRNGARWPWPWPSWGPSRVRAAALPPRRAPRAARPSGHPAPEVGPLAAQACMAPPLKGRP